MSRPSVVLTVLCALLIPCIARGQSADRSKVAPIDRPNIVVIMADDLGYGDLGCFGGQASTPNIDRLAREGLRFTDFHSNGAVCSPTRAAFLTGQYQQRSGIVNALGEHAKGLPAAHKTVASYLREQGYRTALFGKWHLGYAVENGPLRHGFDEFRGHLHGALDYFSKVDQYGRVDWWHNTEPVLGESRYATEVTTNDAVAFITANRTLPFFAFVSYSAIHFPWQTAADAPHRKPGERSAEVKGPRSKLGPHTGDVGAVVKEMIVSLDQGVGRIVETLKAHGLDRRTLVVFTSDNGGILNYAGGHTNISSNGALRGAKGSLYEGGHRVPTLAWWPGRIRAGTVTNATAMSVDLMPTFLELAQISVSNADTARAMDGITLVPVLFEEKIPTERNLFWLQGEFKAVRGGPWKFIVPQGREPELYNLDSDLGEKINLAAKEPKRVAAMQSSLTAWERAIHTWSPLTGAGRAK